MNEEAAIDCCEGALPDLSLSDDTRRLAMYLAVLEMCELMSQTMSGGKDMMLVIIIVAMNSMKQRCTNVSSVADALGMERKTARRHLKAAVDEGFLLIHHDKGAYPVYTRNPDPEVQVKASALMDRVYYIFHRRLGTCDCGKFESPKEVTRIPKPGCCNQ